jgi:hypothetical protein
MRRGEHEYGWRRWPIGASAERGCGGHHFCRWAQRRSGKGVDMEKETSDMQSSASLSAAAGGRPAVSAPTRMKWQRSP